MVIEVHALQIETSNFAQKVSVRHPHLHALQVDFATWEKGLEKGASMQILLMGAIYVFVLW